MNKELAKYLSCYKGLNLNARCVNVDPEPEFTETALMNILNEVFAVDPVSGLPQGDLIYYLSPDGNPTVKSWLEQNLLAPRAKISGSSVEGVTDDLIAEYAVKDGEDKHSYVARLSKMRDDAISDYQKFVESKKTV